MLQTQHPTVDVRVAICLPFSLHFGLNNPSPTLPPETSLSQGKMERRETSFKKFFSGLHWFRESRVKIPGSGLRCEKVENWHLINTLVGQVISIRLSTSPSPSAGWECFKQEMRLRDGRQLSQHHITRVSNRGRTRTQNSGFQGLAHPRCQDNARAECKQLPGTCNPLQ